MPHRRAHLVLSPDRIVVVARHALRIAAWRRRSSCPAGLSPSCRCATARAGSTARRSSGRARQARQAPARARGRKLPGRVCPPLRRLSRHVEPIGPRWWFPLGLVHAERYIDERLVLVGDAATASIHRRPRLQSRRARHRRLVEVLIDASAWGSISAPPTRSSVTRNGAAPTISPWSPPPICEPAVLHDIKPLRLVRDLASPRSTARRVRRFFVATRWGWWAICPS